MNNCYLEKIVMENNDNFECLLIKPNTIKHISWIDIDYSKKIANMNIYESITTNADNFIEILATKLNISKYNISDLSVKTEIIAEEPYYVYELLYVDLNKHIEYQGDENLNEVASLLNTNGDNIFSTALLFKNYFPSLSESMTLVNVTTLDIQNILYNRVNTKIVTWDWDNNWKEIEVIGDLNIFAKNYFEDCDYKKLEIGFLMHNINIWYIEEEYGEKNICGSLIGSLIQKPLEKCIWFTLISDDLRGNITLQEINKIIYLSNKLTSFKTPPELIEDKIDNLGRKIIYNKYKVLDFIYNKNI